MTVDSDGRGAPAFSIFLTLATRKTKELYLSASFAGLLIAQQVVLLVVQRSAVMSLERDGMLVANHPAQYGLIAALVILVLFLGFSVVGKSSSDRESGTLETLFYGPISAAIYILAEVTATVGAVIVSSVVLGASLLIGVFALGYDMPSMFLSVSALTLLTAVSVGSVGMLFAFAFRHAKAGMIATVALVSLSVLLFAGNFLLSRGDLAGSLFLVFVRALLAGADAVFRFVFPLGLFFDDIVRYLEQGSVPVLHVLYYPAYSGAVLYAAVRVLRRTGVMVR